MKKVWEENWRAEGGMLERVKDERLAAVALFHGAEKDETKDEARAKLAAQAPAFARLLLKAWRNELTGMGDLMELEYTLRDAGVIE